MILRLDHPAVIDGGTIQPKRVFDPSVVAPILKSGMHNRKIGSHVVKGKWAGMPIYTLTLEERATCHRGCQHWLDCFGNKMHLSQRFRHGEPLERALEHELTVLQRDHRDGFVVRLHVLGDFYSTSYVQLWFSWLRRFPALHVFGYTAWPPQTQIGRMLRRFSHRHWDRFAIRLSNGQVTERGTVTIDHERFANGAIVCPAQTDRTDCCGTCALCWQTKRNIAFLRH